MKRSRLIYSSTATDEVVSNEILNDIATKSASANAEREITGMLLVSGNRFLQVLEGPHHHVNALFRSIMSDPRHRDVELVSFEPMDKAYFEEWNMRLVDLYDLPRQPREYLAAKYSHKDGNIIIPEDLHEVYALLLDAKALCLSNPWEQTILGAEQSPPAASAAE